MGLLPHLLARGEVRSETFPRQSPVLDLYPSDGGVIQSVTHTDGQTDASSTTLRCHRAQGDAIAPSNSQFSYFAPDMWNNHMNVRNDDEVISR